VNQSSVFIVKIWGIIVAAGDGSVHVEWFLQEDDAHAFEQFEVDEGRGWNGSGIFTVETYVGAAIYDEAMQDALWREEDATAELDLGDDE
tara:strand:+ start:535 stop:804 length:270 start_codon:yes stop_codon:yes gene_type:complete